MPRRILPSQYFSQESLKFNEITVYTVVTFIQRVEDNITIFLIVYNDKESMVLIINNNESYIIRPLSLIVKESYTIGKKLILTIKGNNVDFILS